MILLCLVSTEVARCARRRQEPGTSATTLVYRAGNIASRRPRALIDHVQPVAYVTDMSKLSIITVPDPVLREISAQVERVDADLLRLADDMLETMYAAPGIGLAAIQVGVPRRLIVLDVAEREENEVGEPIVLFNPTILSLGDETRVYEEGCLSLPDIRLDIERPTRVKVGYIDRDGRPRELDADGLLATALQHEIDHLDGKLIIDFLSRLKRDMIVRKLKKQARQDD